MYPSFTYTQKGALIPDIKKGHLIFTRGTWGTLGTYHHKSGTYQIWKQALIITGGGGLSSMLKGRQFWGQYRKAGPSWGSAICTFVPKQTSNIHFLYCHIVLIKYPVSNSMAMHEAGIILRFAQIEPYLYCLLLNSAPNAKWSFNTDWHIDYRKCCPFFSWIYTFGGLWLDVECLSWKGKIR